MRWSVLSKMLNLCSWIGPLFFIIQYWQKRNSQRLKLTKRMSHADLYKNCTFTCKLETGRHLGSAPNFLSCHTNISLPSWETNLKLNLNRLQYFLDGDIYWIRPHKRQNRLRVEKYSSGCMWLGALRIVFRVYMLSSVHRHIAYKSKALLSRSRGDSRPIRV